MKERIVGYGSLGGFGAVENCDNIHIFFIVLIYLFCK